MAGLMTWQEVLQDRGRQDGLREGRQEARLEIAGKLLRAEVDEPDVVRCTGLSVESVAELKHKLKGAG